MDYELEYDYEKNVTYDEVWNLDVTFARFIVPRLKYFKAKQRGYLDYDNNLSEDENSEKTDIIFRKMIHGFEHIILGNWGTDHEEEINEGLDLFRKHFQHLWI